MWNALEADRPKLVELEVAQNSFHRADRDKIGQGESQLRKLLQVNFVKCGNGSMIASKMNWTSLITPKIRFSGQSATWPLEKPRVYMG